MQMISPHSQQHDCRWLFFMEGSQPCMQRTAPGDTLLGLETYTPAACA